MPYPTPHIEQIAFYLGSPWKVNRLREPCNWLYEIIDGKGRCLYFHFDGNKYVISGKFPRDRTQPPYHADYKSIGLSIGRPAKQIAADIKRRLIPYYLASYERAANYYQEGQAKQEQLNHIALLLSRTSGGRVAENSRAARTIYFEHGTANLWSDETITLDLSRISVEQAIRIMNIMRE